MRLLLLLAGLCLVPGAEAQTPKKPAARQVDDTRSRALLNEAHGLLAKGEFARAEEAGLQLLQENVRTFGADHPNVAVAHQVLGEAQRRQSKFNEAEGNFRRMLTIYERRLGADHEFTAAALNSLALVLERLGDYPGAETLLRRSHAILEKKLGKDHPDTATTLSNLSRVLDSQGKFAATQTAKPAAGAASSDAAQIALRAQEAERRGQYGEAETLHHQVLAIHEKSLGPDHPTTANSLSNLGRILDLQGKYEEAEKTYRRALGVREKVLGGEHPDVATSLNNLAKVLQELGRDQQITVSEARARARAGAALGALTEVETMYRRALAIQDAKLGRDHPDTANTLSNLGAMLALRGDFAQAEQMQRAALGTMEKVFGEQHLATAGVLTSLSQSLDRQGKIVEAEASYLRAIAISRVNRDPRTLLLNTSSLAMSLAKRGRDREALPLFKEAIETLDSLYAQTRGYTEETRQAFLSQFSMIYRETIRVLIRLHRAQPGAGFDREALAIASRNQSRVFTELMRQADVARFSGDPAFVRLRERREQLQERVAQLRQGRATVPVTLVTAAQRIAEFDAQIAQAEKQLTDAENQLWREYPRFMELANPRPVTVEDLQAKLLTGDEALVSYVLLPQETVIFALTRDQFRMAVTPAKRADIAERVHRIRRAIDKVAIGESVLFLRDADPDTLHSLYRDVFAPVAPMLAGRSKVLVVADGPLQTVPFELFVTSYTSAERAAFERAKEEADGSADRPYLAEYAKLSYLSAVHRFAYLPSLSALASQRLYPKRASLGKLDLIAFADPVFDDATRRMPGPTLKALAQLNVGFGKTASGAPAIPRLAETAEEAKEIARVLGGSTQLYVGEDAQERVAKKGDLRAARFVLFATHGFLGGEYLSSDQPLEEGEARRISARPQAQPALALTLVGDLGGEDGLLTMKEVIEDLELNAELVALSACNTAGESAQANNGEGFAGLTRAFMYAGAKSLLVSHWSVDSLSTQALMTSTFRNIKTGMPALNAVNDAQRQLLAGRYSRGEFHFSRAHPFFWAAFVYVGD
ncbi:MAG TPA: CHAT domain-containing tetratricopeptide repeat protein [Burkholderiales bacterium]|nr:CHAT domain-containing tetratricopeptide repeat protein [Burkholderiales bacterium]